MTLIHGKSQTRLYQNWWRMIARCDDPRDPKFEYYGGRGITVCDRWRNDFTAFLSDMGPKPSPLHSIDRINNDGNYEPSNCRWATKREQSLNRRLPRVQERVMKDDKKFERWLAGKVRRMTQDQREKAVWVLQSLRVARMNANEPGAEPFLAKFLAADTAAFQETMRIN